MPCWVANRSARSLFREPTATSGARVYRLTAVANVLAMPPGPRMPQRIGGAMRSPRARPRPSAARPPSVVLTCGLATLDVVQTVDHVPAPDEKLVATDLVVAAGGPAATAAVTCSTLGIPARLLSRIGDGPLASIVAADLREAGVDVVDVGGPSLSPPVSTVLVTRGTGERAVVSVNATASGARQLDGSGTDLPAGLLAGAVEHDRDAPLTRGARAAQGQVEVMAVDQYDDGHH